MFVLTNVRAYVLGIVVRGCKFLTVFKLFIKLQIFKNSLPFAKTVYITKKRASTVQHILSEIHTVPDHRTHAGGLSLALAVPSPSLPRHLMLP